MVWSKKITEQELKAGIAHLAPEVRKIVWQKMAHRFDGSFGADDVTDMIHHGGISKTELMLELIQLAKVFARPGISKFYVGAVAEGLSGGLYLGSNLEFPNQTLSVTVHAEQAALALGMDAEGQFKSLAVSAAPCGHCRQFMTELNLSPDFKIMTPQNGGRSLKTILPENFGPKDLGSQAHPQSGATQLLQLQSPLGPPDQLVKAALGAASQSHTPYSQASSGVAIRHIDGRIFTGRTIENAAFNPTLPALQNALIHFNMAGCQLADVDRVILCEEKRGTVEYEASSAAIIENLLGQGLETWVCSRNLPKG